MFDLPVTTKPQRAAATRFRNLLLDQGFQMAQFSVYVRYCAGRDQMETYIRRVEAGVPTAGSVHIFAITDKQYETARTFRGKKREQGSSIPNQLALF